MKRCFSLILVLLGTSALLAVDPLDCWPQWRGPDADGTAPRATPPVKWDDKTNIAWKVALPGKGSATPIVWGDQIFVVTAVDTGRKADPKDVPPPIVVPAGADPDSPRYKRMTKPTLTYHQFLVLALDRKTGKELWRRMATEKVPHEGIHGTHSYAAGSPVTDGKRLYLSLGSFGTYAYDLDGKLLWHRDLGRIETRLGWGEAVTPALYKDRLFVAHDHEGPSFLAALDTATGKTLWKVDRDEPSNWTTPLVVTHAGRTQVVLPGHRHIRSYDPDTGKLLWEGPGLTLNAIPSAVTRDGIVYCVSGYRGDRGAALDLGQDGKVRYELKQGMPYVPSPALAGNRLWFTQKNDALISSIDIETGKPVIDRARLPGLRTIYSSPLVADGRVYISDREGTTVVLRQADKLEVLATNALGEAIDASPVAVGKQLLLRGEKHLFCIEDR